MKKLQIALILTAVLLLFSGCAGIKLVEEKPLYLEVELSLWDKSQWTDKAEDALKKKRLKAEVYYIKISDKEIGQQELETLFVQEISQTLRQDEIAKEFRSRFNFTVAVAQIIGIKDPAELQKFIQKEFPWRWALGASWRDQYLKKAMDFSPELSNQMIEVVLNADQYETVRLKYMPAMQGIIADHKKKLENFSAKDLDGASQLLKDFAAYPASGASLGEEALMLEKEIARFLEAKDIPTSQVQNAFIFLVTKEWFEAWFEMKKDAAVRNWLISQNQDLLQLIDEGVEMYGREAAFTPSDVLEKAKKYRLEFVAYLESQNKTFAAVGDGDFLNRLARFNQETAAFWESKHRLSSFRAAEFLIYNKWLEDKIAAWNDFFFPNVHAYFIGTFDYNDPKNIWLWQTVCRAVFTKVPEGLTAGEFYEQYFAEELSKYGLQVFGKKLENRLVADNNFLIKSVIFSLKEVP